MTNDQFKRFIFMFWALMQLIYNLFEDGLTDNRKAACKYLLEEAKVKGTRGL